MSKTADADGRERGRESERGRERDERERECGHFGFRYIFQQKLNERE